MPTIQQQAEAADQVLRLPETPATRHARPKLALWQQMAAGTLKEMQPR
jgi:hypothetical protein